MNGWFITDSSQVPVQAILGGIGMATLKTDHQVVFIGAS